MKNALVLGSNGQDGTFLCRHLLERGYSVVGVGRQPGPLERHDGRPFDYASLDLTQCGAELTRLLEKRRPDVVFHVAAVHASSGLAQAQYEPVFGSMLSVNVGSLHAVLEYLRLTNPEARAIYAGSAKVFGAPLPPKIDESTARANTCLYSITKNSAGDLIRHYRAAHGAQASQLFLFNHESELRPASFFIPKLARALAQIADGQVSREQFATLDFHCDWGSAEEYMDIAIDCIERAPGEDFVLASGRCLSARELAARLASEYGGTFEVAEAAHPSTGQPPYAVSTAKLEAKVRRGPKVLIESIVRRLVERYQLNAGQRA